VRTPQSKVCAAGHRGQIPAVIRFDMRRLLAILAVLFAASWAHADRAAVERTLARMQEAVQKADIDGYMAHVSRADAIFHKEQYNWVKDLKRRPVTSVTFSIGEPAEGQKEDFGPAAAHFELDLKWTMDPEREGGRSIDRSISLPVLFVLDDSGKWVFAGEDWATLEGGLDSPGGTPQSDGLKWVSGQKLVKGEAEASGRPGSAKNGESAEGGSRRDRASADLNATPERPRDVRFQGEESTGGIAPAKGDQRRVRVKYFPGFEDVAARIVQVLPDVRDHVDEGFGGRIDRVQEVKLYPNMKHLQESIYLSYTDGLSGWNEPGESIKLLVSPRSSASRLRSLLAHEYGHVATFEFGPHANDMPWWVLEGVAELSSERFAGGGRDADAMVIQWSRRDRLSAWDDLADFHTVQASTRRDLQAQVYKQGQHMLGYISERFGREGRNKWLRAMSQGKTIDEATRETLGMSFADLDEQWRAAVKELDQKDAAAKAKAEKAAAKGDSDKKE